MEDINDSIIFCYSVKTGFLWDLTTCRWYLGSNVSEEQLSPFPIARDQPKSLKL